MALPLLLRLLKKLQHALPIGRDTHFRELVKGSSVAFFLKIGSALVIYLFQFFIAKLYGEEGNGLFSFCYAILNILIIVGLLGLETYLIRNIADFASKNHWGNIRLIYKKALKMAFLMTIGLGLVLYFSLPTLMEHINKGEYTEGLQITAIALIPATILRLNAEALRGLKKIKLYSLLQNLSILAFALLGIGAFECLYHQKENILWGLLLGEILVMAWSFYLWNKHSKGEAKPDSSTISGKSMLQSSIPFLLASTVFFLLNWTDKIMLGFMVSQGNLGIYEIAAKVSQLGNLVIFAINTIAAPKFSEFYGKAAMEQFKKFTQQTTAVIFLITLPIILIILVFPEFLLGIFGEAFLAGKSSLYLLTIGTMFSAFTGSVIIILNMTGKQKTSQYILLVTGIVNVLLNYLFIPVWGIKGAALATMLSTGGWNLAAMIAVYRYYGFWTINFKNRLRP